MSFWPGIVFALIVCCFQVWLLALVILPARSPVFMRYGIVLYLALLSIWVLPDRVWMV